MKRYAIKEIFDTLQGEGGRAGARSIFIRFAGCNLWNGEPDGRERGAGACARWCDTDFRHGEKLTAAEILSRVSELWPPSDGCSRWVVLTGGEPMLQVDEALLDRFGLADVAVAMETNGTIEVPPVDWLTVSPKLGSKLKQLQAEELKVVLPGGADGWSDEQLDELALGNWERLYVQPQDPIVPTLLEASYLKKRVIGAKDEFKRNVARCVEVVKRNPNWRLSFQTHKVLGLP